MNKYIHWFIIGTFVCLYAIVSIISTIHVIEFFKLSNPEWLAISLAISFEIGAAASLASIIILKKIDANLVWGLFILLTAMQAMGNTYYAFVNLDNYQEWINLFGLNNVSVIEQKRILSIISGAILPIIALGFIKSLVDYLRPDSADVLENKTEENKIENDKTQIEEEAENQNDTEFTVQEESIEEQPTSEVNEKVNEIDKQTEIEGDIEEPESVSNEKTENDLTKTENQDKPPIRKQQDNNFPIDHIRRQASSG